VVLDFLKKHGIDVRNCRGQSYDNASNMAGHYSGLQARFRAVNKYADYVPCAGHSLNLVGVKAAESCTQTVSFFGIIQKLYTFFSGSTHRWDVLLTRLRPKNLKVVKRLIDTRWSAHADAVKAVAEGLAEIINALQDIVDNPQEEKKTINEAKSLIKKVKSLDFVVLCQFWNDILSRFNAVSKSVQSENSNLASITSQISSLKRFVSSIRDDYSRFEEQARKRSPEAKFNGENQRERQRSTRITSLEGDAEETIFNDCSEKFRIETFLPIIDALSAGLEHRSGAYEAINQRFSFIEDLPGIYSLSIIFIHLYSNPSSD